MSSHKATLCLYGINVILNIIKINIFSFMTSIATLPTLLLRFHLYHKWCSRICFFECYSFLPQVSINLSIPYMEMVRSLHAMQETQVQSLGWEDPQEKEMANHSSILAWKIPWVEEPGRLQTMESQRPISYLGTYIFFFILFQLSRVTLH